MSDKGGLHMKITFIGATHEVTGSCYYLEAAGKKFLVDCGMEQGPDYYENRDIPGNPADIDFVLLTHAHMDHSGNLPAIMPKAFRDRFMPQMPPAIFATLCFATALIYRCLRLSGEIERENGRESLCLYRHIPWKMPWVC